MEGILGATGRIARRLPQYEERPEQLLLAAKISEALKHRKHIIAEAGTGTGKSFAYLVPAILHATEDQGKMDNVQGSNPHPVRRVVVSTHTISLQEQLLNKDIPLLNSVIPREFSAVLFKGRGNYLSKRRLATAHAKAVGLLSQDEHISQLQKINQWARASDDGSRSTLPFQPASQVWDEVASDTGNCLRQKCPSYKDCFYFKARRRTNGAQILIVNHALFFSDLALRRVGVQLLPDYDAVVLDECHTLEAVAGDHLGIRITNGQIDYLLNKLYNDRTNKGLLVAHDLRKLQNDVDRCRYAAHDFFADVTDWLETSKVANGRVMHPGIVKNNLREVFEELAKRLKSYGNGLRNESDAQDFHSAHNRMKLHSDAIRNWIDQTQSESVYWVERNATRRGAERISLAAAPLDVGATLREELFKPKRKAPRAKLNRPTYP